VMHDKRCEDMGKHKRFPRYVEDGADRQREQVSVCERKLQFPSQIEALRGTVGHVAYLCEFCRKWHRSRAATTRR
jgi:hypothetical protein